MSRRRRSRKRNVDHASGLLQAADRFVVHCDNSSYRPALLSYAHNKERGPSQCLILPPKPSSRPNRRFRLPVAIFFIWPGSVAAVGAAVMVVPLVDRINPDAATLAATGPVDIDITKIQPRQRIITLWAGKPSLHPQPAAGRARRTSRPEAHCTTARPQLRQGMAETRGRGSRYDQNANRRGCRRRAGHFDILKVMNSASIGITKMYELPCLYKLNTIFIN